uniref:hypothetical protein n=1 Tax=Vibrio alfacsensis TaxID=1074311 RepID=UPI001F49E351|nr:hypothetical protein [Vibrio alfacsensis]
MKYRTYDSSDAEKPRLQDREAAIIYYVDVIEQMLVKAKGKTPQRPSSDKVSKEYTTLALPFCALCFRRVNQSPYYCKEHHSSRNANAYKQATRRLMSAVYRHASDLAEQVNLEKHKNGEQKLDAKTLYRWLDLFSTPSTLAITELNKLDQDDDWQAFAQCILDFSSKYYPNVFNKLPKITDAHSFQGWIIKTVKDLGGQTEANMWQYKDADVWIVNSNLMQKSLTILNCLSRFEAVSVVENFEVKTGPKAEVRLMLPSIRLQINYLKKKRRMMQSRLHILLSRLGCHDPLFTK